MSSPFSRPSALPLYPEAPFYSMVTALPTPLQFNGWMAESMSWKTGCYIHSGLSGPNEWIITGPDAERFLSANVMNGFNNFRPGVSKHAIVLTEEGFVMAHGVLQKESPEFFRWIGGGPYLQYLATTTDLDVKVELNTILLLQIGGPTSLSTLERATGEDLRDLKFLHYRPTQIVGKKCEVARVGMCGTLAYEIRGEIEDGPTIYDHIYQSGKPFGIERLGWLTYNVNHVEAGFPQNGWTLATPYSEGFLNFWKEAWGYSPALDITGSVDPADLRARYRTPVELRWDQFARFDHDFVGREALEREIADPKRRIVTLKWNKEDVADIYNSMLTPGDHYKQINLPTRPFTDIHAHADYVLKDGKRIGHSNGTTFSYYYRDVLSLAIIDIDQIEEGNEVIVQWGDYGGIIKDVRATVERYPYLDLPLNQKYDLSTVPSGLEPAMAPA